MSRATLLFADRDVEFDDILLNGELGGSTALLGFLASRRGQLMRRLVSVGSDEAAIGTIKDSAANERFLKLAEGTHVIGSDFECDVVLLDDAIAARQLEVDVSEGGVFLKALNGNSVVIDPSLETERALVIGESYQLGCAQEIVLGDCSINFAGEPLVHVTPKGALINIPKWAAGSLLKLGVLTTCGIGMIGVAGAYSIQHETSPKEAQTETVQAAADEPSDAVSVITRESLTHAIREHGFTPERVEETSEGFLIRIYLSDTREKQRLERLISEMGAPIFQEVFLESSLLSAANIILKNTDHDAQVKSIDQGVLTLSGKVGEKEQRAELADLMRKDIPGIKDVRFANAETDAGSDLMTQIAGVWYGTRPYVIMKDGTLVTPGKEVSEGLTLVQILDDGRLRVSQASGEVKEMRVK